MIFVKTFKGYEDKTEQIDAATNHLQSKTSIIPNISMILGSGLGDLVGEIEVDVVFPYGELSHFPVSTVVGYARKLVLGTLKGKEVMVMQ